MKTTRPSLSPRIRPRIRRWGRKPLMAAIALGCCACGDGGTGAENTEKVTVQGTITDPDGVPRPELFAHLVYGHSAAPIAAGVDETDAQGRYTVTGRIPDDQCHAVQIWVLEIQTFSAGVVVKARGTVGECGTSNLDIEVEGIAPASH